MIRSFRPRAAARRGCGILLCALGLATPLQSQVAPDLHWQTIKTDHFRVHFGPGLEAIARRAAGSIERAYGRLAKELHEPRGPIDLTIADNVDVSNGYTTVFPTNRIVIYARPTVDATSLSFLDDWIDLVVTHELTHTFHLDRTAGWWGVAQHVFGRNPFLFPNLYTPSWLDEGIAVYYESRLTGSGRIVGTDHAMIVRAAALDGTLPALNALSASTLSYPLGQSAYAYGSLLLDFIARTQGADKMREFVDASAARTIPFFLNANAKRGFGVSFESAWRVWTDSIRRNAFSLAQTSTPIRDLTGRGWTAERVRWIDPTDIIYANDDGRSLPALREVPVSGAAPKELAIRKSLDVTSPLPDGARVVAQADFTDPYTVRNDLYLERDGHVRRLTNGARLMQPDARLRQDAGDATPGIDIVCVQVTPGADRLVRVRVVGGAVTIAPLTGASPDTVWSEPRWSHDGTRIAATHWTHGGESEIAILDTAGRLLSTVGRAHAVNGAPSWATDDRALYFTSDRTGRSALYRATVEDGSIVRIAESATGLFENEPSPDGTQLATLHYKGDGYHVALVPARGTFPAADSTSVLPRSRRDTSVTISTPATTYSPLRSLLPRYWLPALEESDDRRPMYGFLTSGSDVIGRHQYEVQMTFEPRREEPNWNTSYQYAGLGNPVIGVTTLEDWAHGTVVGRLARARVVAGTITRRSRTIDVAATLLRPRVTTNAYLSVGAETEWQDYRTEPPALLASLNAGYGMAYAFPAFFVNVGWSNARRPALAISPEDGVQFAVTAKQRWLSTDPAFTRSTSVIGTGAAYESLDLPGFAHHVLALRAAAGWEDEKATDALSAGGISGTTLSIAPGVTLGDPQRTFFARGFPAGIQQGTQALGANFEYRAPIAIPALGLKTLPVFLQRVSGVIFADAASAWCPFGLATSAVCAAETARDWMSSAGAEVHLDAAYQYDVPYTFRFGVATPLAGKQYFGRGNVAVYFAVGLAF